MHGFSVGVGVIFASVARLKVFPNAKTLLFLIVTQLDNTEMWLRTCLQLIENVWQCFD